MLDENFQEYRYLPIGVLILDQALNIESVNFRFCEIFNINEKSLKNKSLDDLFSPKDRKGSANFYDKLSQYQKGFLDVQLTFKLNTVDYFVRLRATQIQEKWLIYVENTLVEQDITYEFLVAQERWENIFKNSDGGIVILDTRKKILEYNKIFFEMMHFRSEHGVFLSEEALMGRNLFSLFENREFNWLDKDICELLDTHERRQVQKNLWYRERYLDVRAGTIQLPIKGFVGCFIIFQDLTERKLAEDRQNHLLSELQHANRQLSNALETLQSTQSQLIQSEKMAGLGQLSAGIAHEINTPLGAIRSSVDNVIELFTKHLKELPHFFTIIPTERQPDFFRLLEQSMQQTTPLNSKEKRQIRRSLIQKLSTQDIENVDDIADTLVDMNVYESIDSFLSLLKDKENHFIIHKVYELNSLQSSAKTIATAADRAAKVVFALKSFVRHDHKGEKVESNLTEGIETALILYHNHLKRGVEVITQYTNLPLISCYPDELNQVWTNLIHNALQAMDNKGKLSIRAFTKGDAIVVSVSDTGKGIPEEIKSRIFEPFFTTKPVGEGSGLGLDIVRKIVEKHQGTIAVDSEVDKGTTFTIILPMNDSY
jgi:PAS domain S-box-containing protein